jgi:hypothetical protein
MGPSNCNESPSQVSMGMLSRNGSNDKECEAGLQVQKQAVETEAALKGQLESLKEQVNVLHQKDCRLTVRIHQFIRQVFCQDISQMFHQVFLPVRSGSSKPAKTAVEILEGCCSKNGYGYGENHLCTSVEMKNKIAKEKTCECEAHVLVALVNPVTACLSQRFVSV